MATPRLRDEARTQAQLEQLRNECLRMPGLLDPQQRALLELLVRQRAGPSAAREREAISPGTLARLIERFGGTPLVSWSSELPEPLARRFGVARDTPVHLAREIVRIVPDLAADAREPRLDLVVAWSDGRTRTLAEVLIVPPSISFGYHETGLVLSGAAFYGLDESAPLGLVDLFAARGGLALRTCELAPLFARLVAHHPHLNERLAARTRHHRVTPLLIVELSEDDDFELALLAHDAPAHTEPERLRERASRVFAWSRDLGWQRWPDGGEVETGASAAIATDVGPDFWLEGPECVAKPRPRL